MKGNFIDIDKTLDHRIRLSIVSLLMVEDEVEFKEMKVALNLTDGNLASHIKALEKADYIKVKKTFIGKKPNTKYAISAIGKKAFKQHLITLEKLINQHKK